MCHQKPCVYIFDCCKQSLTRLYHPPIHPSILPPTLSIYLSSIYLSICIFIYLSIYLSIYRFLFQIRPFLFYLFDILLQHVNYYVNNPTRPAGPLAPLTQDVLEELQEDVDYYQFIAVLFISTLHNQVKKKTSKPEKKQKSYSTSDKLFHSTFN